MAMLKISITVPADLVEAARLEAGEGGLSAFVTTSLRRRVAEAHRRKALDEYLADMDERFGPLEEEEVREAMAWLKG